MDEEIMTNENYDESITDIISDELGSYDGSMVGKVIVAAVAGVAAVGAAIYVNRGRIKTFFDNRAIKRLEKHGHMITKVETVESELQTENEE